MSPIRFCCSCCPPPEEEEKVLVKNEVDPEQGGKEETHGKEEGSKQEDASNTGKGGGKPDPYQGFIVTHSAFFE